MTLSKLTVDQTRCLLASKQGLQIRTGPFSIKIQSNISLVTENLYAMYQDSCLIEDNEFIDFHVSVKKPKNIRSILKPQVQFYFDGNPPFKPLPFQQAFPMLEWGLNLCVSSTANQFLIIHAAVVEKNGAAIILPGPSGSGKSTLCAALINSGWRLLSDELTLISRETGLIQPLARPVSLKNQSIEIIKNRYPDSIFTNITKDTAKGTVAHMRAPSISLEKIDIPARARFVIFPKYAPNKALSRTNISRGQGFISLIDNSFNYSLLGEQGFRLMSDTIHHCNCIELKYSKLDDAIEVFDHLASKHSYE